MDSFVKDMSRFPEIGSKWVHFKDQRTVYTVLAIDYSIARYAEDDLIGLYLVGISKAVASARCEIEPYKQLVVYFDRTEVHVRTLENFLEKVEDERAQEFNDGYRFKRIAA